MIWKTPPSIEGLNMMSQETAGSALGIHFTEIGDDYLIAEMPVDARTVQPLRMLHGGASCLLAETLGSVAGMLMLEDITKEYVVGVDINASHLRGVREGGKVFGKVTPIRVGRTVQVWHIEITDQRERMVCVSRLTCQVIRAGGRG
ncbi:hotdog fold thioesterase [Neolewinella lacunae]|uniref:Hotdog fold thioesterase n=1 Tax=Neolewinella lacunae TaxID=1517758 RepID=A0A923TAI6_9BACT|nr:hotdog fold thioesterase [Neolewinella lacunae]MBC6996566.1 hotdog fold thioesterase [Neolewinella lacunae]MDN3634870.1 hotdog fold thioesterase [Neolewinella lacunae]